MLNAHEGYHSSITVNSDRNECVKARPDSEHFDQILNLGLSVRPADGIVWNGFGEISEATDEKERMNEPTAKKDVHRLSLNAGEQHQVELARYMPYSPQFVLYGAPA